MTTGADTVRDVSVEAKRCPDCGSRFGRDGLFCPFDGTALIIASWDPSGDPLTGTVVSGRYEVLAPLGEGGMGTVYKVRHLALDRFFAMKVLRRELAKDPALATRFLQEARATAAIHHPAVVAINDFGALNDGAPYFVMELLQGETLATYLAARGILPPPQAAAIARRLAEALEAAHRVAVVHRDLKPENVFLVGAASGKPPPDDVRIVDFGAAKIMGKTALTRPGVVFGTPYYMSPEQASGGALDGRADVYSLGILLYEMITGSVPFEADTYMGVLTKHMFQSPTRPSEKGTGVQLGPLEDIVMRALEKEPNDRYISMAAFATALEKSGGVSAGPRGTQPLLTAPAAAPPAPKPRSPSGRPVRFPAPSVADKIESSVNRTIEEDKRRQRRLLAIAAVAVIGGLGLVGLGASLARGEGSADVAPVVTTNALPVPPPAVSAAPVAVTAHDVPPPEPAPKPSEEAPAPSISASVSPAPITRPVMPVAPVTAVTQAPRPAKTASAPVEPARVVAPPASTPSTSPPRSSDEFKDPWAKSK